MYRATWPDDPFAGAPHVGAGIYNYRWCPRFTSGPLSGPLHWPPRNNQIHLGQQKDLSWPGFSGCTHEEEVTSARSVNPTAPAAEQGAPLQCTRPQRMTSLPPLACEILRTCKPCWDSAYLSAARCLCFCLHSLSDDSAEGAAIGLFPRSLST